MKKHALWTVLMAVVIFSTACSSSADQGLKESYSPLKKAALEQNIILGAAADPGLLNKQVYRDTLANNFTALTPENHMKWQLIHPERDRYNFSGADALVQFAEENDMTVRGHTLVWHSQVPSWVNNGDWTREELMEVLKEHIFTVAGRYKGKIYAWDVVNEAFDGSNYRNTIWYRVIGPEYIEMAFRWAHEADPDALLYYNDYSMEGINLKSDFTYKRVQELLEKGVPIHGVGLQTHLTLEGSYDFESMYQNVKRFNDLGLKVDITEADIKIKEPVSFEQWEEQAEWYGHLMELLISAGDNNVFVLWGVSDAHSWIPNFARGYNDALAFDHDFQPKPAVAELTGAMNAGAQELGYREWAPRDATGRFQTYPFIARLAGTLPVIDGQVKAGEWDGAVVYPFLFNQLDPLDQRMDSQDIGGSWRVLYKGNQLYGMVERRDNATFTNHPHTYECDNVEIFIYMNDQLVLMRSLIGQGWETPELPGSAKWNEDGTILEFLVELPDHDPTGLRLGWNIAMSDNDEGPDALRANQAYPVRGDNKSWQGIGLTELFLEGITPRPSAEPFLVTPFDCPAATQDIQVDGKIDSGEWDGSPLYPLGFNQLDAGDQRIASEADLKGSWSVLHKGNRLYGRVYRQDDVTVISHSSEWLNDNVEIFFMMDDQFVQLRSLVGRGWSEHSYQGQQEAAWSADGSVFEFAVDLPAEAEGYTLIGWNIGLSDNDDGENRKSQIYPVTGVNDSYQGKNLGELILY